MSKVLKAAIEENNNTCIETCIKMFANFKSELQISLKNEEYDLTKKIIDCSKCSHLYKIYTELYNELPLDIKNYLISDSINRSWYTRLINHLIEMDPENKNNILTDSLTKILSKNANKIYPNSTIFYTAIEYNSLEALKLIINHVPDNQITDIYWNQLLSKCDDNKKIIELINDFKKKLHVPDFLEIIETEKKLSSERFNELNGLDKLKTHLPEIINICIKNKNVALLSYIRDNLPENPKFPEKLNELSSNFPGEKMMNILLAIDLKYFGPLIYLTCSSSWIRQKIKSFIEIGLITIKDCVLSLIKNNNIDPVTFAEYFEENKNVDWTEIILLLLKVRQTKINELCNYLLTYNINFDKKSVAKYIINNEYYDNDYWILLRKLDIGRSTLLKYLIKSPDRKHHNKWILDIYNMD